MRKMLYFLVIVVFSAAIGAVWMSTRKEKPVEANTSASVAVDITYPSETTMSRTIEIFGSLSPKNATEVKNELPGRICKMWVKEWDHVKPNDLLLELDPTDFALNLKKNEAGLKMARAQLLQAKVDLSRAKREWDRAIKLKQGGLVTGQEQDERKTAFESAQARVALAEAQVAQAESQAAEAHRDLEKTRMTSPIDGTISQRKVDLGDWVDKGALLFSVVDNRTLDFTATVPATDLGEVSEGQLLSFTVDGLPGKVFQGRIKRINPLVSAADRSGKILAEVDNSAGLLKGGVFARGRIVVEERAGVLALPKAALMGWNVEKGNARVFLVDASNSAVLRELKTGLTGDSMVEIRSGLNPGDKVVYRGGFNLREGDKVHEASVVKQEGGN